MGEVNRQWLLKQRPAGAVAASDFEYSEEPIPDTPLNADEVRVKNVAFLCAPTMRNWMDPPGNNLYPSIPLGEPMMAPAVARVVDSTVDDLPVGTRVFSLSRWQDYTTLSLSAWRRPTALPEGITFLDGLGRFGLNPMTAYFGLLDVGEPVAGETLVVSGAAGSTGSTVAQIGRIKGLKVIGIAGGETKCRWLVDECGIDAAIDYKTEDVPARLKELCPQGINVFFDNVGGDMLQAAVDNMAPFGRIVLCGQISGYDGGSAPQGPQNMMRLIYGSIRMQGFLCGNYAARFGEAIAQLRSWSEEGLLIHKEDIRQGFDQFPTAFSALFNGSNTGTLMIQIDDSATQTQ